MDLNGKTIVRRLAESKSIDRVTGAESGEEYCKPLGDYSMCPLLRAKNEL